MVVCPRGLMVVLVGGGHWEGALATIAGPRSFFLDGLMRYGSTLAVLLGAPSVYSQCHTNTAGSLLNISISQWQQWSASLTLTVSIVRNNHFFVFQMPAEYEFS